MVRHRIACAALIALASAACAPAPAPAPGSGNAVQAAPAASPPRSQAALVSQGRQLAEMLCATCHAVGTTGESPERQAPAFRTLAQRYPIEQLEEAMAEGILTGHPMMPNYSFSEGQIDALMAYLKSIQVQGAT